ncbi:MAG: group 1 truncated hemoglobin [Herminiimonas sp.]|nr:group 1 truncated hemoglobin [Herminiimonas sp.]
MATLKEWIMPISLKPDRLHCLLLVAVTLAGAPARAQVQPPAPSEGIQAASATDGFYEQLGGKDGVAAIVAEFVSIMLADKRIADTFEGVDMDRLHAKLAEQFCMVSGGPCRYSGKSMQEVHEDMKINNARFNASAEDLQIAMTRRGVPSRVQNRLLGKLAPTQRSIVTQ